MPAFSPVEARSFRPAERCIEADLAKPGLPREKVLATVVRLLETTYIRIGNVEYAKNNKSYGLTALATSTWKFQRARCRRREDGRGEIG